MSIWVAAYRSLIIRQYQCIEWRVANVNAIEINSGIRRTVAHLRVMHFNIMIFMCAIIFIVCNTEGNLVKNKWNFISFE